VPDALALLRIKWLEPIQQPPGFVPELQSLMPDESAKGVMNANDYISLLGRLRYYLKNLRHWRSR
jgi:hypothetical protein